MLLVKMRKRTFSQPAVKDSPWTMIVGNPYSANYVIRCYCTERFRGYEQFAFTVLKGNHNFRIRLMQIENELEKIREEVRHARRNLHPELWPLFRSATIADRRLLYDIRRDIATWQRDIKTWWDTFHIERDVDSDTHPVPSGYLKVYVYI